MTMFQLTIDVSNAAFDGDDFDMFAEISRILRKSADNMDDGQITHNLIDINGNKVGRAVFVPDPKNIH